MIAPFPVDLRYPACYERGALDGSMTQTEDNRPGSSFFGSESRRMWVAASRVSYIGIFFGVAICLGYFFGRWLDRKWHTDPWLSLAGLLIGIASGFRELIRIAGRMKRDEERMSREDARQQEETRNE